MKTVEEVEQAIAQLKEEHKKQIAALQKKIEELEKRLLLYESPHIPSSKRIIKEEKVVETPKKRGALEGHLGVTRRKPKPDIITWLKPKQCECGSTDITILKESKRIVEDIRMTKITTEFHNYDCLCNGCKKHFTTTDAGLPRRGGFGPNITSLWQNMHYIGTVPFDRLSKISESCFGISISPGGLHNVVYRTAETFQPTFDEIKERVSNSDYVRSDETSYPYNGKNHWLWNLSTTEDTLVLLRDSRGAKVLKEVFGDFLDGVLNSDCYSSYGKFKAREYQKCWAHSVPRMYFDRSTMLHGR